MATSYVLTLSCPDRPGIVHAVSGYLFERGGNILESQQFDDTESGRFFMRIVFAVDAPTDALHAGFAPLEDSVRRYVTEFLDREDRYR